MSLMFSKAKPAVLDVVRDVLARYHLDLASCEPPVTVGVLMADDPDAEAGLDDRSRPVPALKLHGYPAAAVVKVTPYKQRVQGIEDAVITIDLGLWNALNPAEREALIDHELQHLEPDVDDRGDLKLDPAGRPKLKLRLHDVQLGVFDAVIRRHGASAIDTQVVRACHERYRQTAFAWGDDMAGAGGEGEDDGDDDADDRPLALSPAIAEAVADLSPSPGSGVESVTLSSGGTSVTLGAGSGEMLRKAARTLRGRTPAGSDADPDA